MQFCCKSIFIILLLPFTLWASTHYTNLPDLFTALKSANMEKVHLMVAIDFSQSNNQNGDRSMCGYDLHHISEKPKGNEHQCDWCKLNPYERVLFSIKKIQSQIDIDEQVRMYGFGLETGGMEYTTQKAYSLNQGQPCLIEEMVNLYRHEVPQLTFSTPTSFAPVIQKAIKKSQNEGYQILFILTDGEIKNGKKVKSLDNTIEMIKKASNYPLSIVVVGVGDDFDERVMVRLDEEIKERKFDNLHYVNFSQIWKNVKKETKNNKEYAQALLEDRLLLELFQEIPTQYQEIKKREKTTIPEKKFSASTSPTKKVTPIQTIQVQGNGKKVALVIGNSDYHPAPLKNPHYDAIGVADSLKDLGFDVLLAENLNRDRFIRTMGDFEQKIKGAEVALFYFAGHGVELNGENYLLPIDHQIETERQVAYNAYRVNDVLDIMNKSGSESKVVILDACRNNPFREMGRSVGDGGGLAPIQSVGVGTLISFSTSPKQIAKDGQGNNSPFASHLIKALKHPELSLKEMLMDVRAGVLEDTQNRQLPWDTDSLIKPIYLAPTLLKEQKKVTVKDKFFNLPDYTGNYSGEIVNGVFEGSGEFSWLDKNKQIVQHYKGQWFKGKEHGSGILVNLTSSIAMKGEWVDGKKHGMFIFFQTKTPDKKAKLYYLNGKQTTEILFRKAQGLPSPLPPAQLQPLPTKPQLPIAKLPANPQEYFKAIKEELLKRHFSLQEIEIIFRREKSQIETWIKIKKSVTEISNLLEGEHGRSLVIR